MSPKNLLPELRDRVFDDDGRDVLCPVCGVDGCGDVSGDATRVAVPVVVTRLPRQLGRERGKEVVEGPGQDHVVVTVEKEHDDGGRPADSCMGGKGE